MKVARFLGGIVAAAALALAGAGAAPAQAQGTPTLQTFSSGFQVQNLSSTTANISIAFYAVGATSAATTVEGLTVPANASTNFSTLPSAVAAGFDGSAVISSDQRVAAVVNIVSPSLDTAFTTGLGGEAYSGVTGGSNRAFVPLLFRNASGFNTFVAVQNVGSAATNITITYSNGQTQTANNVAPGSSARFDQRQFSGLSDGFIGSATITSSASDIAAVVTQASANTVLIYNGFSGGSNNPVFPLVNANNAGFVTGIAIQNAGTAPTTVTVAYTPSTAGTACTEVQTIAPGAQANFAIAAFAQAREGENCANGAAFVGSARVSVNSGNQPLVGIVNQLNSAASKGGAYAGFDAAASSVTNTVVYPIINDRFFGFFTGLSIFNAGTVPTTITCTFSGSTQTQTSGLIQPGGAYTPVQQGAIANQYNGSAVCTGNAQGARLVGIGNQLGAGSPRDAFFVYEGINN